MNHPEAFCLMKYQSDDKLTTEFLWNSRDGVTPFGLTAVSGEQLLHVDWKKDAFMPEFVPPDSMRVFVSATEDLVRDRLLAYVDRIFEFHNASTTFASKEEAYRALLPAWLNKGEAPWVVTGAEYLQLKKAGLL